MHASRVKVAELLRSVSLIALVGGFAFAAGMRADAAPRKRSSLAFVARSIDDPNVRQANSERIALAPVLPVPPQSFEIPPATEAVTDQSSTPPQLFPPDVRAQPFDEASQIDEMPTDAAESVAMDGAESLECTPVESRFNRFRFFGLRHSSTDGRNAGLGLPLVGSSWLNRPYYLGAEFGAVWITTPPQENISRDTDTLGGIYFGCDWDYYWGTELAVQRATPELKNETQPDVDRGDRMMLWTANMMYYPWGDSHYRPYWRLGIGEMEIDFPVDDGRRRDEDLWAVPIGIGIKFPVRRWLAARAEFTDAIGLGNTGVATQHNMTLTFALEWRFGARPRSYWPWHPSRHIW